MYKTLFVQKDTEYFCGLMKCEDPPFLAYWEKIQVLIKIPQKPMKFAGVEGDVIPLPVTLQIFVSFTWFCPTAPLTSSFHFFRIHPLE